MRNVNDPSDWNAFLMPGETVLWTGQPPQGLRLTSSDFFLIPFSLAWSGIATPAGGAIMLKGITQPGLGSLVMIPFGGLFFFVGIHLLLGRFFVDRWIRRRTSYAITNRRAFIAVRSLFRRTLRTVALTPGAPIAVSQGRRSDISIGVENHVSSAGSFFSRFRNDEGSFTFEGLNDGECVYKLLLQVQNAAKNMRVA